MTPDVDVTRLDEGVYIASRSLGGGEPDVRAALFVGARRAVVVDTLARPEDMAPLIDLIAARGLPVVVVNTHADWDHAWGNAAFSAAPIVGHQLCRTRLLGERERAVLARKRAEDDLFYANVQLLPPDVTFETTLRLDLGGLTVELHHAPGHQPDCLVAYVPERRLLYAGDCAEDPFPLLNSGPREGWIQALRAWSARDLDTVVPSHGRIGGVELLKANADYLAGLDHDEPPPVGTPDFYLEAHTSNQAVARRLSPDADISP